MEIAGFLFGDVSTRSKGFGPGPLFASLAGRRDAKSRPGPTPKENVLTSTRQRCSLVVVTKHHFY